MKPEVKRQDLIEPELSYDIVGCLFDVYNSIGFGYSEVYYQRALAAAFDERKIAYKREVLLPVIFHGQCIGRQRCDFLVEGRVLIEMKKGKGFSRQHIEQVVNYLIAAKLPLAILANITPTGIMFKRVINSPHL